MSSKTRPHVALWAVPVAALAVALFDLPYGYYQLLRVLVFCVAGFLAYRSHEAQEPAWTWIFAGLAITYNPIVKLHVGAEVWPFVNVATILLLVVHLIHVGRVADS